MLQSEYKPLCCTKVKKENKDEKITALQYSKSKIQSAKADYETKLQVQQKSDRVFLKDYPERVILLSDTLETPAFYFMIWLVFIPRMALQSSLPYASNMRAWGFFQRENTCAQTAQKKTERQHCMNWYRRQGSHILLSRNLRYSLWLYPVSCAGIIKSKSPYADKRCPGMRVPDFISGRKISHHRHLRQWWDTKRGG